MPKTRSRSDFLDLVDFALTAKVVSEIGPQRDLVDALEALRDLSTLLLDRFRP